MITDHLLTYFEICQLYEKYVQDPTKIIISKESNNEMLANVRNMKDRHEIFFKIFHFALAFVIFLNFLKIILQLKMWEK